MLLPGNIILHTLMNKMVITYALSLIPVFYFFLYQNNTASAQTKDPVKWLKDNNHDINIPLEEDAYNVILKEMKEYVSRIGNLNTRRSRLSPVDRHFTQKAKDIDNEIDLLIQEHNVQLLIIKESYPGTFTSDVLVSLYLVPQITAHPELKSEYDNKPGFMHDYFFEFIDFADKRVIYGQHLKKKYFAYLNKYTHHVPEGFRDSVDVILGKARVDNEVFEFTIQTLIDFFYERGSEELVSYIIDNTDNYVEGCNTPLSEVTAEQIEIIKRLRIGQRCPNIVSKDPDGNPVTLSSSIGKDVVMIYFWASWCHYCQRDVPNMVKVYNRFKDMGFEVYAVALESDKREWISAIKNNQLAWINASSLKKWDAECVKTYNVRRTPTTYLVDYEGEIIAKNFNSTMLETKLNEIFNQ